MAHAGYGYQWRPGGIILVPLPTISHQQVPSPIFPTLPPPPYYPHHPHDQSARMPPAGQAPPTSTNTQEQQAAPPRVRHAHFRLRSSTSQKPKPKAKPMSTKARAGAKTSSLQPAHTQQPPHLIRSATVTLHCIHSTVKPWELPKQTFSFNVVALSCFSTVRETIEKLGGGRDYIMTECLELGDGRWAKGTSIAWSDVRATRGVGALGWSRRRGVEVGPIWVVVSKK